MKQIITEIFIEVEEISYSVKSATRKRHSAEETEENIKPVTEICPHCHQAIFETESNEIEGDLEI